MQVQVHHINAEVARTRLADQRVHVGAIHIKQPAFFVQDVGNFMDLLLKNSQRVGIGQHQAGDIFIHLCFQRADIDHAV